MAIWRSNFGRVLLIAGLICFVVGEQVEERKAAGTKCAKDRVYNECGSPCDNECPDSDRLCPAVCVPGCYCPRGMVEVDGECVDKGEHCDSPEKCPGELEFTECGNPCANLCPDTQINCPAVCVSGCFCPAGKMQVDGKCVDREEHCERSGECRHDQVFEECGSPCNHLCPGDPTKCTKECQPGCYCKRGMMEVNGTCVSMEKHCKDRECGPHMTWKLGNVFTDSCPDESPKYLHATRKFLGCFCDEGFYMVAGECVPLERCYNCTEGLTFDACGSACANECPDSDRMCPQVCVPGCYCEEGMMRVGGKCVDKEEYCCEEES